MAQDSEATAIKVDSACWLAPIHWKEVDDTKVLITIVAVCASSQLGFLCTNDYVKKNMFRRPKPQLTPATHTWRPEGSRLICPSPPAAYV